ncbi:hypothetical protein ACQP1O_41120 [Nocardia sp. CA-151230]|uniref:hypothetical protein n=1 Tax=Nocardia sp. CA-151230 TaxID=3239982 RepID=UPI003D8FB619
MKSIVARQVIVMGAIPLALAVACSNTNDHPAKSAQGTSAQAAAQPNGTRTPGNTAAPEANPQPGAAAPEAAGIAGTPSSVQSAPRPGSAQPGVALPARDQDRPGPRPSLAQPGITVPKHPLPPPQSPPQADYPIPANFRPIPDHEAAPAVDFQTLHAPTVVDPVLPIAPPPRTVRIGDFTTPAPDQLPDNILDTVNGAAADTEAGLATGLNSIGVNPTRSDKIAAGTLGGAAIGTVGGALAAGAPMAVVGGVPGAAVGALVGLGAGAAVGTVVAGGLTAGAVAAAVATGGVGGGLLAIQSASAAPEVAGFAGGGALIGAAAGGAAGAAALGIPAAVLGGAAGGVGGAAVGGFLGGTL